MSDPERELDTAIDHYSPTVAAFGRDVLEKMRVIFPSAVQMVYDTYNSLVVGFVPGNDPSEAIFSVNFHPQYIGVVFLQGARINDPDGLLMPTGTNWREVRLTTPNDLDDPAVLALFARAVSCAKRPFESSGNGGLVIKTISATRRPRRL